MSLRLHCVWTLLHAGVCHAPSGTPRAVDPVALRHARAAVRRGEFDRARALLADWNETVRGDAACLNVLGVLAVADSDWKKAVRLWQSAVHADRHYQPPRQNLRRYYELFQFGRSRVGIALGDELGFQARRRETGYDA